MTRSTALALAIALSLAGPFAAAGDAAAPSQEQPVSANPFFAPSTLPYQLPPFDQIKDEHYAPALEKGMAEQRAEVAAIAANPAAPTFENTIVALEKTGEVLNRVSAVFFNLAGANTNPAIQAVQAEFAPKLAAHSDAILLDGKLFARIKALYDRRAELGLDAESLRLL